MQQRNDGGGGGGVISVDRSSTAKVSIMVVAAGWFTSSLRDAVFGKDASPWVIMLAAAVIVVVVGLTWGLAWRVAESAYRSVREWSPVASCLVCIKTALLGGFDFTDSRVAVATLVEPGDGGGGPGGGSDQVVVVVMGDDDDDDQDDQPEGVSTEGSAASASPPPPIPPPTAAATASVRSSRNRVCSKTQASKPQRTKRHAGVLYNSPIPTSSSS